MSEKITPKNAIISIIFETATAKEATALNTTTKLMRDNTL